MAWGRKFISGLVMFFLWTLMLIADVLTQDSYISLMTILLVALFGANTLGKFTNGRP